MIKIYASSINIQIRPSVNSVSRCAIVPQALLRMYSSCTRCFAETHIKRRWCLLYGYSRVMFKRQYFYYYRQKMRSDLKFKESFSKNF